MVKRILLVVGALVGVLMLTVFAIAQSGTDDRPQRGERMNRPVYGTIIQIDVNLLVVKPQIPAFIEERLAEHDQPLPELPAEVQLKLNSNTEFFREGELVSRTEFAVGDIVVVQVHRGADPDNPLALRVADEETARRAIQQVMHEFRERRAGSEDRDRGGRQIHPVFGEIISTADGEVTIAVEIPDFIQAELTERGIELPADLPSEVTLRIAARTKFIVQGEEVTENPFAVGDKVAVIAGPGREGEPAAWAMSDYDSAQRRMEERKARQGDRRERGGPAADTVQSFED